MIGESFSTAVSSYKTVSPDFSYSKKGVVFVGPLHILFIGWPGYQELPIHANLRIQWCFGGVFCFNIQSDTAMALVNLCTQLHPTSRN